MIASRREDPVNSAIQRSHSTQDGETGLDDKGLVMPRCFKVGGRRTWSWSSSSTEHHTQGDVTGAETHFQQAIAICDEVWPVAAGVYRGSFALLRAQQGAFDEARSLLAGGEPQVRRANKMELGKLLCKKARVEHLAGDPAAAETALGEAESIAIELDACPVTEAWVMTQELSLGGSHLEPDGRPDSELNKILAEAREAISG